ncbi:S-adenosyl-methyltransferase mraW, putative [Schistosoma mansoni]|uniref:S-adenosyl-methyltransferase mraW, putative n=1 Tax=Schistosoma mansoni TaxID=6183 RepID=UPI0001A634F9|nr:S-adenosyl-methyltransferase mraW, putative [Schistosoma mansoni]|eukprot:XP_018646072.1 S-adenosyl-methyltransferase mraW, putative [Schistosoma mansoni]
MYLFSLLLFYVSHKIYPLIGRFSDLPQLLNGYNLKYQSVDLILMDLGVSSLQLDIESRGFGFKHNAPLDMRMNQSPNVHIYGEERLSKRIANAIVDYRNDVGSIQTTKQLADLIHSVVPMNREGRSSIHPATRVFQALRIFINDELNELCIGLELAEFLLKPGGYLVVLSFHSLEDRLVKWSFHSDYKHLTLSKYLSQRSRHFQCINKRQEYEDDEISKESLGQIKSKWNCVIGPITPSDSEIDSNPRSRSAKLRIAKRG